MTCGVMVGSVCSPWLEQEAAELMAVVGLGSVFML